MKTALLALALLAGVAAAALAPALAQDEPAAPQRPGAAPATLAQLQARMRTHVMRADTNHDGRVSLAEWMAWRSAHPGRGGGDPERMFQRMDLNHDGFITPDEIDAAAARRFARQSGGQQG